MNTTGNLISGELEFKEYKLSPTQLLRICVKSSRGTLYVDVRKYIRYSEDSDYCPSKKGVMLEFEDWKRVIPLIESFVNANMSKAGENNIT